MSSAGNTTTDRRQAGRQAGGALRLREDFAAPFAPASATAQAIDEKNGIIKGVRVCGTVSRNKRRYPPGMLAQHAHMYEDVAVYLNPHPQSGQTPRDPDRKIGWLKNLRVTEEGLFGDLHLLTSHPASARIMEAARKNPKMYSLSHDVDGDLRPADAKGYKEVTRITEVWAVDLVDRGGTNQSLFEEDMSKSNGNDSGNNGKGKGGNRTTLRRLIEGCSASPSDKKRMLEMGDPKFLDAPVGPPDDGGGMGGGMGDMGGAPMGGAPMDSPLPEGDAGDLPPPPGLDDGGDMDGGDGDDFGGGDPKDHLLKAVVAFIKTDTPEAHEFAKKILAMLKPGMGGSANPAAMLGDEDGGDGPPVDGDGDGNVDEDGDGEDDEDDDSDDSDEEKDMKESNDQARALRRENKRLTEEIERNNLEKYTRLEAEKRGLRIADRMIENIARLGDKARIVEHLEDLKGIAATSGAGKSKPAGPRSSGAPVVDVRDAGNVTLPKSREDFVKQYKARRGMRQ